MREREREKIKTIKNETFCTVQRIEIFFRREYAQKKMEHNSSSLLAGKSEDCDLLLQQEEAL